MSKTTVAKSMVSGYGPHLNIMLDTLCMALISSEESSNSLVSVSNKIMHTVDGQSVSVESVSVSVSISGGSISISGGQLVSAGCQAI